jgi:hypothetical protein
LQTEDEGDSASAPALGTPVHEGTKHRGGA